MHPEAYEAVRTRRPSRVRAVYEVGSRNVNGGVRDLFLDVPVYYGVDVLSGQDVDAVGDGGSYVPPFVPDCVVCCEVLEHADDPESIVRQMAWVVGSGGTVIITCAGPGRAPHSGVDGMDLKAGESYANIDPDALAHWLTDAGLSSVVVDVAPGVSQGRLDGEAPGDVYARAEKP